jgi:hypothetical protein
MSAGGGAAAAGGGALPPGEADRQSCVAYTSEAIHQLSSVKSRMLQRLERAARLDAAARGSCKRWSAARRGAGAGSYLRAGDLELGAARDLDSMVLSALAQPGALPMLATSLHNMVRAKLVLFLGGGESRMAARRRVQASLVC